MRSNFRTGLLVACPELLETVPRPVLVAAIVRHATSLPIRGEAIRTHHEHEGISFHLETDVRRKITLIRLTK